MDRPTWLFAEKSKEFNFSGINIGGHVLIYYFSIFVFNYCIIAQITPLFSIIVKWVIGCPKKYELLFFTPPYLPTVVPTCTE